MAEDGPSTQAEGKKARPAARTCLGCLAVSVLSLCGICIWLLTLDTSPRGRFESTTGIELPENATLVHDETDVSKGFATEGWVVIGFRVDAAFMADLLQGDPPWGSMWRKEPLPEHIPRITARGEVQIARRGDAGDGAMLVADVASSTIWVYWWLY